jgi:hypothetical protein
VASALKSIAAAAATCLYARVVTQTPGGTGSPALINSPRFAALPPALILLYHHLSGLDDHANWIAFLELKLFRAGPRYHAFDNALADPHDYVGHDCAEPHFLNDPRQLVSGRKSHINYLATNSAMRAVRIVIDDNTRIKEGLFSRIQFMVEQSLALLIPRGETIRGRQTVSKTMRDNPSRLKS